MASELQGSDSNHAPSRKPRAKTATEHVVPHRFLTKEEWSIVAHGIGGIKDHEAQIPVQCQSRSWPAKGLPPGLYREVVEARVRYAFLCQFVSAITWILVILQIALGATLTALGAMANQYGGAITVLAAWNTINAGLLALIHNSGLPGRYRANRDVFADVELHFRMLLDTALVEADQSVGQVLVECYDKYSDARSVANTNVPTPQVPPLAIQAARQGKIDARFMGGGRFGGALVSPPPPPSEPGEGRILSGRESFAKDAAVKQKEPQKTEKSTESVAKQEEPPASDLDRSRWKGILASSGEE